MDNPIVLVTKDVPLYHDHIVVQWCFQRLARDNSPAFSQSCDLSPISKSLSKHGVFLGVIRNVSSVDPEVYVCGKRRGRVSIQNANFANETGKLTAGWTRSPDVAEVEVVSSLDCTRRSRDGNSLTLNSFSSLETSFADDL